MTQHLDWLHMLELLFDHTSAAHIAQPLKSRLQLLVLAG